ncbi:MAG TPA: TetR/AcrR family transcriptional regulator [Desulfobacteraceae bacterium]|nr:TetR family transcriptional regulator [Deltaproteobacteria bacterium]MBW2355544.1 TetR family transcriptional regulator [Deltaproteobacteria bacterium]HDI59667.1 TetR/AcrR family transcriptional regulator [Desulfobacteraceae bacterium]
MTYRDFKKSVDQAKSDLYRETLARHPEAVRVKKEATAVRNLERIFAAALKVANEKGFAAMTLRDLSAATGMSMGALYAYFSSKEELLAMLQEQHRSVTRRILEQALDRRRDPMERLRAAVRIHLYLSEAMQPWFFFAYMEARHLPAAERKKSMESELATEKLFEDLMTEAVAAGALAPRDCRMAASLTKAMVQDWYLKRWKHAGRRITVDQYADAVLDAVESYGKATGH